MAQRQPVEGLCKYVNVLPGRVHLTAGQLAASDAPQLPIRRDGLELLRETASCLDRQAGDYQRRSYVSQLIAAATQLAEQGPRDFRARLRAASFSRKHMADVMANTLRELGYDVSAWGGAEWTVRQ